MTVSNDGVQRFDGIPVVQYEGKFTGSFDIDEDVAVDISYDDVVTFVVTARSGKASIDATKFGDMKRSTAFNVVHTAVLDAETARAFYDSMDHGDEV